ATSACGPEEEKSSPQRHEGHTKDHEEDRRTFHSCLLGDSLCDLGAFVVRCLTHRTSPRLRRTDRTSRSNGSWLLVVRKVMPRRWHWSASPDRNASSVRR